MPTVADAPPARRRARDKHWSESRTFAAAVGWLLLLVTAAVWWQQDESAKRLRAEAASQAELRAAQVTSAVSAGMGVLFRAVDVTSRELANAYAQGRKDMFEGRLQMALERLPPGVVLQVAAIGPDGMLTYSNLGTRGKVYLGDREHFKVHLGTGRDALFISKPVLGRVSNQWSIQFSRPILAGGRFAGVLVLSLSPTYLQQALAQVAVGSDDSISVLRASGELLARNRDMEARLGRTAAADRPYMVPGAPAEGSFTGTSSFDQVPRLFHWQRLQDYPVMVVLGLDKAQAFGPVERAIAESRVKTLMGLAAFWGAAIGLLWLAQRANAQARHRQEMEFVAMNDGLTGLQSRHALMQFLDGALDGNPDEDSRVALLYMDLDGFKAVNDQFGHAAGDVVLKEVGSRIRECIRADDMAARIGGDEFVVVLASLSRSAEVAALRARLAEALARPIDLGDAEVRIGASMGVAIAPEHGSSADALLAHADHEMYARKAARAHSPAESAVPT